jgi:hypothetical protein
MSNQLELLSNELLLEIFEYLDAYNLYQAFHGLNHRMNTLLQSANLHIILKSSYKNKSVWDTLTSFLNPLQIRVLSSYDDDVKINKRFLSSAVKNLYSVRLYNISVKSINEICQRLSNDNQIKSLYITEQYTYRGSDNHSSIDTVFVDHGHQFTSLINLSLAIGGFKEFPMVSFVFSQLRHLSIQSCYYTLNFFQFLQDRAPNLRSLKFLGYVSGNPVPSQFVIKHVHELHIQYPEALRSLAILLSMFPCLRRLRIEWVNSQRSQVVDGTQWQELIEKYLPQLKQLTIDFDEGTDAEIVKTFYTGDFWTKKRVNVKTLINKTGSRFPLVKTIYFGRQWHFGYFDHFEVC